LAPTCILVGNFTSAFYLVVYYNEWEDGSLGFRVSSYLNSCSLKATAQSPET